MGAAFDDDLIEAVATVVSTEARAFNNFNRSGLDYWVCKIRKWAHDALPSMKVSQSQTDHTIDSKHQPLS